MADRSVSVLQLHPLTVLLAWMCGVIALQRTSSLLFPFLVTMAAALSCAKAAFVRLLSRSRWLLLTLVVTLLWMTPGSELAGWGGRLGLTAEGCATALNHLFCFVSVLGLIALLLVRLDTGRLVFGIYVMMAPLASIGLDRDRLAVRLMLTLHQASPQNLLVARTSAALPIDAQCVFLVPSSWSGVDLIFSAILLFMLAMAFLA